MRQTALLILFVLGLNFLFAQIERVQYQGKSYFVYPHAENTPHLKYNFENLFQYVKIWAQDSLNPEKQVEVVQKIDDEDFEKWRMKQDKKFIPYLRYTPFVFYENTITLNSNLIPVVESIPDGDYLQYYHHLPYIDGDTLKYNYTTIAAIFSIKNNLPEGPACWFTASGDTLKFGSFSNGLKQGVWIMNYYTDLDPIGEKVKDILNKRYTIIYQKDSYSFNQDKVDGLAIGNFYKQSGKTKTTTKKFINYQSNVANGEYSYFENEQLMIKGAFKNGEKSGEWFYYEPKSEFLVDKWVSKTDKQSKELVLVKHFTIPETPKTGKSVIIRSFYYESEHDKKYLTNEFMTFKDVTLQDPNHFPASLRYHDEKKDFSFSSFYKIPGKQPKGEHVLNRGFKYEDYQKADFTYVPDFYGKEKGKLLRFTRQELIDSLGYEFLYDGIYEEYYPNGQLRLKFEVRDGVLQGEDTVFWYNGKPANVVNFLPETKQYEEKMFSINGELEIHRLFDEHGKFLKILKDKHGVCISHLEREGRLYFEKNGLLNYTKQMSDQLTEKTILSETLFKKDSSLCERIELDPLTRTFSRITRSIDDQYYSEENYQFDSLYEKFTGSQYIRFQNAEPYNTEKLDRLESTFRVVGSSVFSSTTVSPQQKVRNLIVETDFASDTSNRWMLNGSPFNGSFVLNTNEKEFSFRASKNQAIINIQNEYAFLERILIFIKPILKHDFSRSNYTYSSNGKFEPSRYEGTFLDGKASGQWTVLNGYKHKLFQTQFDQGKIYGNSYSLAFKNKFSFYYSNPRKKSKRHSRYLESVTPLKNGILDGTFIQYNPDGSVKVQIEYKAGLKQGWSLDKSKYNQSYFHQYLNDQLNGISYTVNRWGDTLEIIPYSSGFKQGKAIFKHGSFTQEVEYKQGKLNGNYRFFDTFQVNQNSKPYVNCEVKEGKANGLFETHNNLGILVDRAQFQEGFVSDSIEKYNDQGFLVEKIKLDGIFMKEQELWKNGTRLILNKFDVRDSLLVDYELSVKSLISDLLNNPHFYSMDVKLAINTKETQSSFTKRFRTYASKITYEQKSYYFNGIKKSEGNITSDKKTGLWHYYDPEGVKLYSIDFKDSLLQLSDSVSFEAKGICYHLTEQGDTLAKSWIINLETNYNCDHLEYQEQYTFYTFWEKNPAVGRINGMVKNYYPDGTLQSQGKMQNGLPDGVWMYYDPFGGLNQVGSYVNGIKEGRWLEGDLGKIAYIGDICLNPDLPNLDEQISNLQKQLKINLYYFKNGKKVNSTFYQTTK